MATMLTAVQSAELTRPPQEPDPQVPERAYLRCFSAFYKQKILSEYEGLGKAGKGALLRREGLYSSLISEWRKQRDQGALAGLAQKRGRPETDPRELRVALNNPTGFLLPSAGMTRPVTVTSTAPRWLTVPVPDVIAHGRPPPLMPRSFTVPTAAPVTGVIELKSVRLPPSSAMEGTALAASKPAAPMVSMRTRTNERIARLLRTRSCR